MDLISGTRVELLKKAIYSLFFLGASIMTYFVGYNSGENSAELKCNIAQQISFSYFQKHKEKINDELYPEYKKKYGNIQQKINSYMPYNNNFNASSRV